MGILAGHAPLMIRLAIGPLRILREGEPEMAAVVDGGFMHVTSEGGDTRVDVLAAGAQFADEIDVEAARRRVPDLEEQVRQARDDASAEAGVEAAQAELDMALARINIAG